MGKISKVLYEVCDDYSIENAAQYYFYSNVIGMNDKVDNLFGKYYENELKVKNSMIQKAVKASNVTSPISAGSAFMAISSVKNKPVILAEI